MTTFTRTWDASYEASPPGTEFRRFGDDRIREFKNDVRERGEVDHSWAGTTEDGKHKKVTLIPQATDPVPDAGQDILYSKDVGGAKLLFHRNATDVQRLEAFPTGTKMLFQQATSPPGWTKVTAGSNDRVLRIVTGTPTEAGSWTISGLTHSHTHTQQGTFTSATTSNPDTTNQRPTGTGITDFTRNADYNIHTHNVTVSGATADASTTAVASDGIWRPAYTDVIAATKD